MQQISDAESRIMEALWRKSPLTPEQVIAAVGPERLVAGHREDADHPPAQEESHLGAKEADGYCYRPLIARAAYVQSESQGLLDRLFKGAGRPARRALREAAASAPRTSDS